MGSDIGFVVGTGILIVFGFLIAFVLPRIFEKDENIAEENLQALRWIRWLGYILIGMSLLLIVALLFLP